MIKKLLLTVLITMALLQLKAQQQGNYIIARGDIADVVVMEHPEFSLNNIVVLPDGYIQYPGLGSIMAAGMTSQQMTDTLTKTLEQFVVNPIVSIFIRKIQNQQVNVFGYVNKPGQYQVFDSIDIFSAIGLAGGLKSFKKAKRIFIIRANLTVEEIPIREYFGTDLTDKIIPRVNAGDTIFVREPKEVNWSKWSFIASMSLAVATVLRIMV